MSPNIKEKLLENWFLKILAILLAWILWMFIQGELKTNKTVTAQVKVQGVPAGMEISRGLPSTVQVTIRGAAENIACNIDLRDAKEGENRIFTQDYIEAPSGFGIEVFQVNPSQVTLMLEKTVSKLVPITIPVQGEVANGFEIYEKITTPRVVEITGPRSHIEQVKEVLTDVIDISDLDQDSRYQVSLNFEDGTIRSSITNLIWVEMRIGLRRKDYTVNKVPLVIDDESYVFSPKQIDIRLMAPDNLQPDLVPGNFSARIPTEELGEAALPAKVKPVISYREEWRGVIKEMGTRPSEVEVSKKGQ